MFFLWGFSDMHSFIRMLLSVCKQTIRTNSDVEGMYIC